MRALASGRRALASRRAAGADSVHRGSGVLAAIHCEHEDECVRIRLTCGTTNALTTAVILDLLRAVDNANRDARGALLCGGEAFFSNGVDLDWALAQPPAEIRDMFLALNRLILALLESPLPVVGVIKGHAIGGALAILMACDYRYAAAGRVLIGKPEILLGVPNPYYGDQLLRFVAGDVAASDLIYTGRLIQAEEGRALNLVHATGPKSRIEQMAWERLLFLRDLAPDAFAESKRMRLGKLCADLREQTAPRIARQVEIWHGEDAQTRLRAAAERLRRRPRRR